MDDAFLKALQEQRKKEIEELEWDLTVMEAQQKASEDLDKEKVEALRDGINGARNALDFLRVAYKRQLPPQPWEEGGMESAHKSGCAPTFLKSRPVMGARM
jgi:hypothetical protein